MKTHLRSPSRLLTTTDRTALIDLGGYTHELFAGDADSTTIPFPGEALLLIAGGLVEQTEGLPAGLIALVEMNQVKFHRMAFAPTTIFVDIAIHGYRPTPSGSRRLWQMTWTVSSAVGDHVSADITMLGQTIGGADTSP